MKLFIQQGHGKGDKVNVALSNHYADGVILSGRDETLVNMRSFASDLFDNHKTEFLLDPQFYYTTFNPVDTKKLLEYPHYPGQLTLSAFRQNQNIKGYVTESVQFQQSLKTSYIVSPSVFVQSFNDREMQITLSLAEETLGYVRQENFKIPLLVSLTVHENAFTDLERINEFLNEISVLDVDGFYVTIARSYVGYDQNFDNSTKLANIMYFVYSLAEFNEFKVVLGYTDILGILFYTVGAYAIGAGWHGGSRRFTIQQRVEPAGRGGLARERYTSIPLLNSILVAELDTIFKNAPSLADSVLTGTNADKVIKTGPAPSMGWNRATSHQQHWQALKGLEDGVFMGRSTVKERLDAAGDAVVKAKDLYKQLKGYGVLFEKASSSVHLDTWAKAIAEFKKVVSI